MRASEDFAHSMVLLKQARNVKYKSFLTPGGQIIYTVRSKTIEETVSSFTGEGCCDGEKIIDARFSLRHFNLADENCAMAGTDAEVIANMKRRWELLGGKRNIKARN